MHVCVYVLGCCMCVCTRVCVCVHVPVQSKSAAEESSQFKEGTNYSTRKLFYSKKLNPMEDS